jgi:hypothetical protein
MAAEVQIVQTEMVSRVRVTPSEVLTVNLEPPFLLGGTGAARCIVRLGQAHNETLLTGLAKWSTRPVGS